MLTTNPHRGSQARQLRAGLELALGSVARPNPFVIAWRWRYEIVLPLLLAALMIELTSAVGLGWALALSGSAAASIAAWPAARRQVIVRAWCVVTQHRVRTGCAQAWLHSRQGKIPIVLWTEAEPFGERVYLWLRAGVSAQDLLAAHSVLVAACWATDLHVTRHDRFAHLVVLDVIRRPVARQPEDNWPEGAEPPSWPQAGGLRRG